MSRKPTFTFARRECDSFCRRWSFCDHQTSFAKTCSIYVTAIQSYVHFVHIKLIHIRCLNKTFGIWKMWFVLRYFELKRQMMSNIMKYLFCMIYLYEGVSKYFGYYDCLFWTKVVYVDAFFCSRQWRHVRQALHPDRQPGEHWVSVASEPVNIQWVCTRGLSSVPCCCDSERANLGPFSLLLNLSLSHMNTLVMCDREKNVCLCSSVLTDVVCPLPTGRPRDCWTRLWNSAAMVPASTATWMETAPSSKSSSPPTKLA